MKSKKYRKKSPPPPPPTQLPETGSNSPPRLLPLLGGEEGFCFLSRLLLCNFHFLSTLKHFLLLNLPVWAIMGNPLNMSAIMFTITPPCSDMYWRCTERRNIQKLFLDCHLLLTWGMFQLDWSQWQHSSPEEFYCSRYVFTFKLTFNVISAAGQGNWPVQNCFELLDFESFSLPPPLFTRKSSLPNFSNVVETKFLTWRCNTCIMNSGGNSPTRYPVL